MQQKTLLKYDTDKYIDENLCVTYEFTLAAVFKIEYISRNTITIFRLNLNGKYLGSQLNWIDNPTDDTLIIYNNNQLSTINSKLILLDNRLSYSQDYDTIFFTPCYLENGFLMNLVDKGISSIMGSKDLLLQATDIIHKIPSPRVYNLLELNKTLFENILKDPVLHMFLNSIYPKGYHCTTYSSNTLRKNEDYTGWHCDYPYHDIEAPYPQETLGVQVIWTLDDFTNENGATHYVPESYKKRCFPYNIDKENVERMIAPFGTVIIYLAKTWHTQGINTTDKPRSALLANFSPLFVPIKS